MIKAAKNSTCEMDPIPTNLLKARMMTILLPAIVEIVNVSLSSGIVPPSLKHAVVRPHFKKKPNADAELLQNYRPVSDVPFLSNSSKKSCC